MTAEPSLHGSAAVTRRWLDGFRHVAGVGDRWFISCVRVFTRVNVWARREAGLDAGGERGALSERPFNMLSSALRDGEGEDGHGLGSEALDLLLAQAALADGSAGSPVPDAAPAPRSGSTLASEPAGVLLLWRALGRVVSQHACTGYRTLQSDERFWALLNLIQSLMREPSERDRVHGGLAVQRDDR